MDITNSMNNNMYTKILSLINEKDLIPAENLLKEANIKTHEYHYLNSLILEKKAWFDTALEELKLAITLAPDNLFYKDSLISLMGRHRHYSDDYYDGYRRRNRGCSCCCCDYCCCDCGNFSCCDLICLDQCCECMGGDLIDCI